MGREGVHRKANGSDARPIGPEATVSKARKLLTLFENEGHRFSLPQGHHTIRREIKVGKNAADAVRKDETMMRERLLAYEHRSLVTRDDNEMATAFREVAEREALIGTPEQVADKARALATQLPVDPIIVRAQWPGTNTDDVVAYLDSLEQYVVPALAEISPVDRVDRSGLEASDR